MFINIGDIEVLSVLYAYSRDEDYSQADINAEACLCVFCVRVYICTQEKTYIYTRTQKTHRQAYRQTETHTRTHTDRYTQAIYAYRKIGH